MMKKPLIHGITAVCFLFAITIPCHAQTGTPEFDPLGEYDNLPKQIRVQVEFIDVSHEQLTELMFGIDPPTADIELRKQVGQLVKDGKATIAETMLCIASSGQKGTTESIEEHMYPTEWGPAELPNGTRPEEQGAAGIPKAPRRDFAIGLTPSAFETRNIGSTLEIEPTLGDDSKIIDLRFVPEITIHTGNEVWAEWKSEHGNVPIQMPRFYTLRLNTSVTLVDGKPMLVAALSPKNQDGIPVSSRKLMVFVKADVISVGR